MARCELGRRKKKENLGKRMEKYVFFFFVFFLTGVTNLRALLAREKDEDTPRLNILLCEAFVASYMSLVTYALATCDCHILYRLAGQKFSEKSWSTLFGGGVKKLLKVAQSANTQVSGKRS